MSFDLDSSSLITSSICKHSSTSLTKTSYFSSSNSNDFLYHSSLYSPASLSSFSLSSSIFPSSSSVDTLKVKTERLRSPLQDVNEKFLGFKNVVAIDSRRKKVETEQTYKNFREKVICLEKNLNFEISNRINETKNLQKSTERLANKMLEKLENMLLKKIKTLTFSLDALLSRCHNFEKYVDKIQEIFPKLEVESNELLKDLVSFRNRMSENKNITEGFYEKINERICHLELSVSTQLEGLHSISFNQFNALTKEIQNFAQGKGTDLDNFYCDIRHDLCALKKSLHSATQARIDADEEIMQTIVQYNTTLEKTLNFISMS